ncbi:hypothetical protein ABQJ54_18565 [Rhodanobacter sp. Si-c]|uniref:Peptidase A2 domain-containing protein n=1 Tax=Rhodanobacter lycopersici TaxID=3162487 RepID=A0ABV3QIU7_9GAMM
MAIVMGLLAAVLASAPASIAPATAQLLPTVYEAGHFYAVPETMDGQKLKLVVDTGGSGGGGMYVLLASTAKRLHLSTKPCPDGGGEVATLPRFKTGQSLPPLIAPACGQAAWVGPFDTLGAGYLPRRTWTFDYPNHRLRMEGSDWHPAPDAHKAPLGFPHKADGSLGDGLAAIEIKVDGQTIPLLLDTGATARPTVAGEKASGTPTVNGEGVTSYITTSVLERWHKAHPEWRVVADGDDLLGPKRATRLIEVPDVEIAGWRVGPVWFTERPDRNFGIKGISQYMDRIVSGSAGANIFQHFVMTLDYPHEAAWFRCVTGCKAVATPPPAP